MLTGYKQKFVFTDTDEQNIWPMINTSSKLTNKTRKLSVSLLDGRMAAKQCPYPILKFSRYFLFSEILHLRHVLFFKNYGRQSYYNSYQVLFYLWPIKPALELYKAPKYYQQDCRIRPVLLCFSGIALVDSPLSWLN